MLPHEILQHLAGRNDMESEAEFASRLEGRDGQFSLDAVPDSMQADTIATQAEVMEMIRRVHHGVHPRGSAGATSEDAVARDERDWNDHRRVSVKVSDLERYSKDGSAHSAKMASVYLRNRSTVVLDETYRIPATDPSLEWRVKNNYLDHMACIPAKQGLAVCRRPVGTLGYRLTVDLLSPHRALKFTHTHIDFDPSGRCAFFGTYQTDLLWCAFVPNAFFDDNDNESSDLAYDRPNGDGSALPLSAYGIKAGDTRLSPTRFKIWQLFWCHVLSTMQWRGVSVMPHIWWGLSDDLRKWSIRDMCNIFDQPKIELTHEDVVHIDDTFEAEWRTFVHEMPAAWKKDKFFIHHKPIIMSQRYGQNTPIAVENAIDRETQQWQEERAWGAMKYVSMAVATELTAHDVQQHEPIPPDDILREHVEVFDTPVVDRTSRPVDLYNYPLEDEDGNLLPLYTREGFDVLRTQPVDNSDLDGPGCGILLDLRRVDELFADYADDSEAMQRLAVQEHERRRPRSPSYESPSPSPGPSSRAPSSPPGSSSPIPSVHNSPSRRRSRASPSRLWLEEEEEEEESENRPRRRRRGVSRFIDDEARGDDDEEGASDVAEEHELGADLRDDAPDELERCEQMTVEELSAHRREARGRARATSHGDERDEPRAASRPRGFRTAEQDDALMEDEVEALLDMRRPAQANKRLRVTAYPQAFLGHIGHMQANQMFPIYAPFMVDIDCELRRDVPPQPDFHETLEDGAHFVEPDLAGKAEWMDKHGFDGPIIEMGGCQIYNAMSHRARPTAGQQEVCTGMLTQAATGPWAPGKRATNLHAKIMHRNNIGLPQDRFRAAVVDYGAPNISLRIENNFTIFMRRMPEDKRTGAHIYRDIILSHIQSTLHPIILQRLRHHIVVFKPDVFPAIYHWMTFPVRVVLEKMYTSMVADLQQGRKQPALQIELLAMMERTLAYAHTGNAAVISGCMGPLWLKRSLLELGFPCLHPSMRLDVDNDFPLSISVTAWPCRPSDMTPLLASSRAFQLTWGAGALAGYTAAFSFSLARVFGGSDEKFKRYAGNPHVVKGLVIADIAMGVLIADWKDFVEREVRLMMKRVGTQDMEDLSELEHIHYHQRESNLKQWKACAHPFSHKGETATLTQSGAKESKKSKKTKDLKGKSKAHNMVFPLALLVATLAESVDDIADGLPMASTTRATQGEVARVMCDCARANKPTPLRAPLIKDGSGIFVLRLALAELAKNAPTSLITDTEIYDWSVNIFALALEVNMIMFVPWQAPSAEARGRPKTKASVDSWVEVDHTASPVWDSMALVAPPVVRTMEQQYKDIISGVGKRIVEEDPKGEWEAAALPLHALSKFISTRKVLPVEFTLENASVSMPAESDPSVSSKRLVYEVYKWVLDNYDPSKVLHQLALMIAIVVSRLAPELGYNGAALEKVLRLSPGGVPSSQGLTKAIQNADWEIGTRSTGHTNRIPYIPMVTTYIIAFFDQHSPVRQHLRASGNNTLGSLGRAFVAKHTVKGINPFNLIRLGLARGLGTAVLKGGSYGVDWRPLSEDELIAVHADLSYVFDDLQGMQSGYSQAKFLFGEQCAELLARKGEIIRHAPPPKGPRAGPGAAHQQLMSAAASVDRHPAGPSLRGTPPRPHRANRNPALPALRSTSRAPSFSYSAAHEDPPFLAEQADDPRPPSPLQYTTMAHVTASAHASAGSSASASGSSRSGGASASSSSSARSTSMPFVTVNASASSSLRRVVTSPGRFAREAGAHQRKQQPPAHLVASATAVATTNVFTSNMSPTAARRGVKRRRERPPGTGQFRIEMLPPPAAKRARTASRRGSGSGEVIDISGD
ncbi:uncharacterized protein C8Q71DRAFT_912237 [Rhodofomes roseus]|uniref:DUF8190 domain-containing protein n=1 Tax=Rhodofomes roseus TaxID=34475 RepID=A0ABQ8JX22_9APHY|nr:uncharacterized protein C8Q71DRAFT_912237 [Rhodofomes roseus]KAH9828613.1 hypothetical protein C8Q71DRAFT_912237 [Rhodofomes roseus]